MDANLCQRNYLRSLVQLVIKQFTVQNVAALQQSDIFFIERLTVECKMKLEIIIEPDACKVSKIRKASEKMLFLLNVPGARYF